MKPSKTLLILVLSFFIPFMLFAEDGTLHLIKGYVKVRHLDTEIIYRQTGEEIQVSMGDRVQTGVDTQVKILLDGKREEILLYSKTLFEIALLDEDQTKLSLNIGKARFKIDPNLNNANLKKNRRFQVRTTTALIGVKGTEFVVGCTTTGTELLALSGIVTLASLADPDAIVEVAKNQVSKVLKDQPPTAPVTISDDEMKRMLQSNAPLSLIKEGILSEGGQILESIPLDKVSELVGDQVEEILDFVSNTGEIELRDVQITIDFQQ